MSATKKDYGNESIYSLKGPDRVRLRPGNILGSDGLDGCEHAFFEILSNAIDEAREGYGDHIRVSVTKDHVITVEDHGRGVPLGWNEREGRYNWDLVYNELYAGGKYSKDEGDAYMYSLGLNGLGAAATQYSSAFMNVTSFTKDAKSTMHFEKGYPVGDLVVEEPVKRKTGTVVEWLPDREVFTDIAAPLEFFDEVIRKQAIVNAGLTISLDFETETGTHETREYLYPNGIVDYVNEIIAAGSYTPPAGQDGKDGTDGDESAEETEEADEAAEETDEAEQDEKALESASRTNALTSPVYYKTETKGRDREDLPEYRLKIELAFCFSNTVSRIEYYHNSSFLEFGGAPDKAAKSAFLKGFDNYLRSTGKYSKNEKKISFEDVEDCLVLIVNSHSTAASFLNQTKKAVTNAFIEKAMTEFFLHCLEVFFAENPKQAEKAAAQVLINKRSRENAESARTNIKKKLEKNIDGISNRPEKFVTCRSKDGAKRELYIVEGDSALGSVKLARNPEFQAVMPVRGKTLNCLKSSYDKIFKSDIIVDLLRVVGCGVEIGNGKGKGKDLTKFDPKAMKWNKIVICTDADEDGYQIRTLILTMFYRLLPTLIREGYVYIAESPLYEIESKKYGTQFAYNEKEKAEMLAKLEGEKYKIMRSKGLGENEPDMMNKTTMNPATRRLIRITPEDETATFVMFNTLLGDDIASRKRYIAENGADYIDLADV